LGPRSDSPAAACSIELDATASSTIRGMRAPSRRGYEALSRVAKLNYALLAAARRKVDGSGAGDEIDAALDADFFRGNDRQCRTKRSALIARWVHIDISEPDATRD
jgi:hypothetical protein